MSKKDGAAAAIAALGVGLLNYGAKKEELRFQREREENLRRLQESQHSETVRHNQAVETYQGESLKADVKHKADTLALDTTKVENERAYQEGQLLVNTSEAASRASEAAARTETDRLNAERQAAEASLVWNPETKKYETDENLLKDNLRKIEAEGKARASAWGGSKGTWETEYNTTLENFRALAKEGKDPRFAGKSDAELRLMAQDSANQSATRTAGTPGAVAAAAYKAEYERKMAASMYASGADKARLEEEAEIAKQNWLRAGGDTNVPAASGGGTTALGAGYNP